MVVSSFGYRVLVKRACGTSGSSLLLAEVLELDRSFFWRLLPPPPPLEMLMALLGDQPCPRKSATNLCGTGISGLQRAVVGSGVRDCSGHPATLARSIGWREVQDAKTCAITSTRGATLPSAPQDSWVRAGRQMEKVEHVDEVSKHCMVAMNLC